GVIPPQSVNEEFLTTLDLFPMVTSLASVSLPDGHILDGHNVLPVLAGHERSPRQEMFWQRRDHSAARVGNWKWIRLGDQEYLFDLSTDIGEQTNLAKSHPAQLTKLRAAFATWEATMQAAEPRGPFRDY
ncbi:MAG: N-acetylgalactosamine-6-sulfatase, partial [Planctomycetaceae bacterium]|nr:N-acetylgalactosamine-6-sulfatase [Planctomycetaceae bacterium]